MARKRRDRKKAEDGTGRPVEIVGGRLCGLPNIRVRKSMNETTFVEDETGKVHWYRLHHVNDRGVDVFLIDKVVVPEKGDD